MSDLNYCDVEEYLKEYNLAPENPSHYDFNGVVHLMLAALDNLRARATEEELEDICYSVTDDQREFLRKIAQYASRRTDAMIEAEGDWS